MHNLGNSTIVLVCRDEVEDMSKLLSEVMLGIKTEPKYIGDIRFLDKSGDSVPTISWLVCLFFIENTAETCK